MTTTQDDAPEAEHAAIQLTLRQLEAIERFHEGRAAQEHAAELAARTREQRMDAQRRMGVLRRQQEALVARTHEQLRASGELLSGPTRLRAVVAHQRPWFSERLVALLRERDVSVVGPLDNGADAVGVVVAEQPDLLVVGDVLVMQSTDAVVAEVARHSSDTLVAAQVPSPVQAGALLDSGARVVIASGSTPEELLEQALPLLRDAQLGSE